jgi:putative membrane protein
LLKILFSKGFQSFWKELNGNFLLAVFSGIGISIISLAKLITYLLKTYPHLVWGFFFGLIVASVWVVLKKMKKITAIPVLMMVAGTVIAYWITTLKPSQADVSLGFVFLSGAIAICAMILPGISGSFILLLMGMYSYILEAVKEVKILTLSVFAAGCLVGLLGFSHFLSWLLKKYHDATVGLLAGFMVGSLNKVWPWKITIQYRINSHGEEVPFIQENILPGAYENPQVFLVIGLALTGFALIYVLDKYSPEANSQHS